MKYFYALLLTLFLACSGAAQNKTAPKILDAKTSREMSDDGVSVLIKNLPNWETVKDSATILHSSKELTTAFSNRPILFSLDFTAGAEAVKADYGAAKFLLIEMPTPQFAADNDAKIQQAINDLRSRSEQLPSAYRRVGNYLVFVFDTDETTANGLIDEVKYQKEVQWLGENPYLAERAERYYTQTMSGVVLSVIYASGYALLAAVALGSIFGAFIFYRRRRESKDAFSDAGGQVRLNINSESPAKMLEK